MPSLSAQDFFARHNDKVIANQFAEPWWHQVKGLGIKADGI